MVQIKTFTALTADKLDEEVNQWLSDQKILFQDCAIQYSGREYFTQSGISGENYRQFHTALISYDQVTQS